MNLNDWIGFVFHSCLGGWGWSGDMRDISLYLIEKTGQRTVPSIFIDGVHIGGNSELDSYKTTKEFNELKNTLNNKKTEL
jgi:hypothetical protein